MYNVGYPVGGFGYFVVDAGLTCLGARVAGTHQTYQNPSTVVPLSHKGASRIALAGILAAFLVSGTHHVVMKLELSKSKYVYLSKY